MLPTRLSFRAISSALLGIVFATITVADPIVEILDTCGTCHGENGLSPNDIWPNLAGQKRGYLIQQLQFYRSGQRGNPLMQSFTRQLTDQDIEMIADYYSRLPRVPAP